MVSPVLRSRLAIASHLLAFLARLFRAPMPRGWLFLALSLFAVGPASAERGIVSGTEMGRFGRVVFTFGAEIIAKARVAGTVMIVEFDREVQVDLEKLAMQLPTYISIARRDPDGKSIRFGLTDRMTPDLKLAGDRVYLDILPAKWQGLPPSLPPEVVQDLVRRAKSAEEQVRQLSKESERQTLRDLELSVGSTPLFKRAIFSMPRVASVQFAANDGLISLVFDANFKIAQTIVRARLAGLVRDVDVEAEETTLRITMRPMDGLSVRGFREDDTFTLDFTRADGQPIEKAETAPSVSKPQQGAAAKPASAVPGPAAKPQESKLPEAKPAASSAAEQNPADTKLAKTIVIGASTVTDGPIETILEAEPVADGFALRLKNMKKAPIAVIPRDNGLLVVIETAQLPIAPSVPEALKPHVEMISLKRVNGGALMHIVPRGEGGFWLAKDGADFIIHRTSAGTAPDAYAGASATFKRGFDKNGKDIIEVAVGEAGALLQVDDPATGQKITVLPATEAVFSSSKSQAFVDFSIERTLAGLAVLPLDEAVTIRREPDTVQIGHEIKLNLSALPPEEIAGKRERKPLMIDPDAWNKEARLPLLAAQRERLRNAAEAPRANRSEARMTLARLYLAHGQYPEASGVLEVLAKDDHAAAATKGVLFHRALAATMLGRTPEATRLLAEPALATEAESRLLQGVVEAKALRYRQANAAFKQGIDTLERYPERLQVEFRRIAIETAIEAEDPVFAREQLKAYEAMDRHLRDPYLQNLLAARLSQLIDQNTDAFDAYTQAAKSPDRRIEAEARFGRAIVGALDGKLQPEEAKAEFETLTAIWRRSEVEVKALAQLGEIYTREGRWRDAFLAAQRAGSLMPEHPVARKLEDAMARRFEGLFLDNEADKLSKIEAIALYQEFRALIPPGRRGDEIVRRLADRLFDLDLVNEASDILDYQIKHRLEGVAKSSVATRLAVIHLQNRQPLKTLNLLRETRSANMPQDLRRARLLLEARALGELFRSELAIEVLADEKGDDVDRLRADIHWKGKNWREAGEAYERVLGESWQNKEALSDAQRADALRAALAYVLAEERLSLDRLRSKFQPKIAKTEDAGAFNLITVENFTKPQAFRDVARSVVNADTMTEFLSSYRKRYPESGGAARPVRSAGDPRQSAVSQPVPNNG